MSGRCKHLFACLFKLEFIVRSGLNDPSVTDGDRQWGLPATKDVTAPQIVEDLDWSMDVFGKTPAYALNSTEKRNYAAANDPLNLESILEELKAVAPLIAVSRVLTTETDQDALCNYVDEMKRSKVGAKDVIKNIKLKYGGTDNRNRLEKITRQHQETPEQSAKGEELWRLHRRLRITASYAFNYYRKASELRTRFFEKTDSEIAALTTKDTITMTLLDALKGIQRFARRLPAPMAWGKENEPTALEAYLNQLTFNKDCPNFKVEQPGLVIDALRPYFGATPDAIVGCECHGRRLVEIKCPYTCRDKNEKNESIPAKPIKEAPFWCPVEKKNGRLVLLRTSDYYIQCTMQMAMTGIYECDFYAWCPTGTGFGEQKEPQLIKFDPDFWEEIELKLRWFYECVFMPFYLSSP